MWRNITKTSPPRHLNLKLNGLQSFYLLASYIIRSKNTHTHTQVKPQTDALPRRTLTKQQQHRQSNKIIRKY